MDCLDTLIGLTPVEVDCFTDEAPEGFDTSLTGYYVTDVDYGVTFLQGCQLAGYTLLQKARAQAIRDLRTDLAAMIRNYADIGVQPWSGQIGKLKASGVSVPTLASIGHVYTCQRVKGLYLVIENIYLGLNATGDYTLRITSNDPTFTPPADITLSAVAGQFTPNAQGTEIALPFYSDFCGDEDSEIEYYLTIIDRNGAQPLYNTFACCGDNPGWKRYVDAQGFQSSSTAPTDTQDIQTEGVAEGLVVKAYLRCDELAWLCGLKQMGGYEVRSVLGRSLQFRTGAIVHGELIDTNVVNLCNLYNLDTLQTKRNYQNKRYLENVDWLAQNIPHGATDCFKCKPEDVYHTTDIHS